MHITVTEVERLNEQTILHVEDEREIRELVGLYLKKEGFQVAEASTAKEAFQLVADIEPTLILLDVHLPDIDGFEACRCIRQTTEAPIIFLSCKDSEMDRVIGLSVGGDDYVGKPFSMNELLARVKVHTRRYKQLQSAVTQEEPSSERHILRSRSIVLDQKRYECYVRGELVQLSPKEFELLAFFMRHPHQVLSADQLLQSVWGYDTVVDTKTVSVHIGNIRRKIGDDPKHPRLIVTLRRVGYKFDADVY